MAIDDIFACTMPSTQKDLEEKCIQQITEQQVTLLSCLLSSLIYKKAACISKLVHLNIILFCIVAGAFMGFDSDELEDSGSDCERDVERQPVNIATGDLTGAGRNPLLDSPDHLPIFEDQLLDGLQMWLDRLFEGSTYRYHINYWPEFPISPANFSRRD